MKIKFVSAIACAALTAVSINSNAALESRLGGLAVYDTDLNLTWLADANAIAGTAFDDGANSADGLVSWSNANAWVSSLSVAGITEWRLPTSLVPDASCSGASSAQGGGCIGSEMGHLYYAELSGVSYPFSPPVNGIFDSNDPDLDLFSNIQSLGGQGGIYWSATERNAANAYYFNFNNGQQSFLNKAGGHYAWAVRDGDVSAVPVPAAFWLMVTGICTLCGCRKFRSATAAT